MGQVIAHIQKGGKTEVTVQGIPGAACHKASAPYIAAIGGEVKAVEPTAEANMTSNNDQYSSFIAL